MKEVINDALKMHGQDVEFSTTRTIELARDDRINYTASNNVSHSIRLQNVALHVCSPHDCVSFATEINSITCPQSLQIGLYLAFGITAMLCAIVLISIVVFVYIRFFKKSPVEERKRSGIHLRHISISVAKLEPDSSLFVVLSRFSDSFIICLHYMRLMKSHAKSELLHVFTYFLSLCSVNSGMQNLSLISLQKIVFVDKSNQNPYSISP
ncbi:hypothetical protein PENTCL1PPCAC_12715 [Pristionchus entomophagus]|uniref:Uncharacterized protein n=1 Tax=Pristionchus entomophagus TaxID=358040 RepID=A0AAV5TDJ9_9BILA|nr:hypothetical protein PENTCL1PPCAC_12715 [Pristionchus entomophagus]